MSRISVFGAMTAKSGAMKTFFEKFATHAKASRAEPGCLRFDLSIDPKAPDVLRFYEIWADQAALDVHAKTPRILAYRDEIKGLVVARDVHFCELRDSPDA